MCFLFSGDEFSAAALLSEEPRIKNTYTDGIILCVCKNISRCTASLVKKRTALG